jgi:hypothetical protein
MATTTENPVADPPTLPSPTLFARAHFLFVGDYVIKAVQAEDPNVRFVVLEFFFIAAL